MKDYFLLYLGCYREVAEWLKAHAWKACIRQRIEGSNPFLSAKIFESFIFFFIFNRIN